MSFLSMPASAPARDEGVADAGIGTRRQGNHHNLRRVGADLPRRLDAVQDRHAPVGDNDVRPQLQGALHTGLAVVRLPDDLVSGRGDARGERLADRLVVIDQNDAHRLFVVLAAAADNPSRPRPTTRCVAGTTTIRPDNAVETRNADEVIRLTTSADAESPSVTFGGPQCGARALR